jgi:aminopeptidase-like protein
VIEVEVVLEDEVCHSPAFAEDALLLVVVVLFVACVVLVLRTIMSYRYSL